MRFSCERDSILKEISIAQEIISSRNALSILSNVLLEAEDDSLLIRATDLKVSFETRIPVDVIEPGRTTTFCEKLSGILRTLPSGEIEFSEQEGERFIIAPRFKKIDFRLKTMSADKYPEIQQANQESFFQIPQAEFIEMVSQTIFAVSDDETRYFMNGVFFEKSEDRVLMVATDGKRLAYIRKEFGTPIPDFAGVIIPPKILALVKKLASGEGMISIAITDKHVFMDFDNQKISSALIEGTFPNYQRVIPESQEHRISVSRGELNEALKRVSLMVERSRRIYMDLSADQITLRSDESDLGTAREDIPCEYAGPETVIAMNFTYLSDPLRVIASDEISIQFTETTRAISINAIPEEDYFHIVMPMNLND
jgi:DNA polymerase-3 subunit beta